jgi:formylglycine-generating enzyme required for sulfatase activity
MISQFLTCYLFKGLCAILACMTVGSMSANNIQVANISLTGQNTTAGANNAANFTMVEFDLSWGNSWRMSTGPANWDAAWVFVKFRIGSGNYQHAYLSPTAGHHTIVTNNGTAMTITPAADGTGVFIHRSGNGTGAISLQDVRLRWLYRNTSLGSTAALDAAQVTVQVFAMEMVYIPQGSFYLGDGNRTSSGSPSGSFTFRKNRNAANNVPEWAESYLVTSENAITTLNNASTSTTGLYDFGSNGVNATYQSYIIPAGFPKGFNAFYMMKYEVSVKQYVDFFNTLPTSAGDVSKTNRRPTNTTANRHTFTWDGNVISDASFTGSGDRAQNYISWFDALSYMDWAGLRPMTEMEYEKACRGNHSSYGPNYPARGEFAWGNTSVTAGGTLTTDNTATERLSSSTATNNCNCSTSPGGAVRVGLYADRSPQPTVNPRRLTGASFYGVMDLTGNVREFAVSTMVYNSSYTTSARARASQYTGLHGNGNLPVGTTATSTTTSGSGGFDVTNWNPPAQGYQTGPGGCNPMALGGSFSAGAISVSGGRNPGTTSGTSTTSTVWITSNASLGTLTSKTADYGIRAVRTAP